MRESEKKVGRADNAVPGVRNGSNDEAGTTGGGERVDKSSPSHQGDAQRHGARPGSEQENQPVNGEPPVDPAITKGSDRGGSASWGSEGSGGSVVDKRPDR